MFLCLKEDGDGPGGAFCPLDQVLENALVKDSFCLYFPSIPYFSQQEIVCSHLQKKSCAALFAAGFQRAEQVYAERGEVF